MKTLLTTTLMFSITYLIAKHTNTTIEQAAKNRLLTFKIRGNGSYSGNCLKIKLNNVSRDTLIVYLECGRRLDSKNNDEQDILVTKEQKFVIPGQQTREFPLNGYCCQANNHAPAKDSDFNIGKMADSNLVALSHFCNINKFNEHEIQSSVWCVSNKRPLASIPASNERLRKFVASITKEELPWYQMDYKKGTSLSYIPTKPEKITGYIDYKILTDDVLKIELKDEHGNLIQTYAANKQVKKGDYNCWFDLQVTHYPKGKFYIHIYNGQTLVTKKEFVI